MWTWWTGQIRWARRTWWTRWTRNIQISFPGVNFLEFFHSYKNISYLTPVVEIFGFSPLHQNFFYLQKELSNVNPSRRKFWISSPATRKFQILFHAPEHFLHFPCKKKISNAAECSVQPFEGAREQFNVGRPHVIKKFIRGSI